MKHVLLGPDIDLISLIGEVILKDAATLQQHVIVFPGKRPIHFLRKYLAETLHSPYQPPHMFSMDEFVDFLYEKSFNNPEPKIAEVDCIPILFALNNNESLINDQGTPLLLDDFMPWGFKLYGDFEELYIEQITPEKLKQIEIIAQEHIPPRIQQQIKTLSSLYRSFYNTIITSGLSTRSSRYRSVARDIGQLDLASYKSVILAGFFALTSSERDIIQALLKNEKVRLFLQKGPHINRIITSLNIRVTEEGDFQEPDIQLYKTADIHGEVMQLSRLLRDAGETNQRSVVVLPQADTLFPVMQHALGFAGSAYNVSMGYPLYRTPLFSLIDSIGQLLESRVNDLYYVPGYLKVVLHPYIKNILMQRSNEPTRIMFHVIEELLIKNKYRLIHLDDIVGNKAILENCYEKLKRATRSNIDKDAIREHIQQIHRICIESFEQITSIHEFCEKLMTLLSFLSKNSTANKHPYTNPYIKTMLQALYDLQTSALSKESFTSEKGYFRLFRNYMRRIRYPFVGTPVKGLQVLGSLETRNLQFGTVYILDVNEGILPHTKKEDTLLPLQVRTYLGLPTHEDREMIARYYFETLIYGAKHVHVLYCESENKEKSRFIERLVWQKQKKEQVLDTTTNDVFFAVTFKQKDPEPVHKTEAMLSYMKNSIRYSATYLNAYLQCPLRFYYLRVHNIAPFQTISADIDPFDRGSVVHKILEEFFLHKMGAALTIHDDDYVKMKRIVAAQFEQTFPYSEQGALQLFKHQVQRRMKDVLAFYAQPKFHNTTVLECENRSSFEDKKEYWQSLYTTTFKTKKGYTVTISGKIDRVDKRNNELMILDYKTGAYDDVPKKTYDPADRSVWHRTLCSVQLPLYILLYQGNNPAYHVTDMNCALVLLGSRSIKEVGLFKDAMSSGEREHMFSGYTYAISTLIDEIFDPDLPFMPTHELVKVCPGCEYQVVCGTQHLVERH